MQRVQVDVGQRFGRLTILGEAEMRRTPGGQVKRQFYARCDCGTEIAVLLTSLRRPGCPTRSCGCLQRERTGAIKAGLVHGHGSDKKGLTPTYITWRSMRSRCYRPQCNGYHLYGGRGITVCDRWLEPKGQGFVNFLADMGERPEGMTLDRVDNDGNYEPGNCQWATVAEQNKKRRQRA
jgi:hypothetical protein